VDWSGGSNLSGPSSHALASSGHGDKGSDATLEHEGIMAQSTQQPAESRGDKVCGIFGTTRPDLWEGRLEDVLSALDHRGPDGRGVWTDQASNVALGHTRLAIIGLTPEANQPLQSADRTWTITYNGEIYNYRDLASKLGLQRVSSDTQVLAEALGTWGPEAVTRFRGMYAFIGWNAETSHLVAARDPLGIKPLYVLHHELGGVTLSSEIPPLLLLPEARGIDPVGLAQYLAFGHTGQTLTLFERIRKIAPGAVWEWGAGGNGNRLVKAHRFAQDVGDSRPDDGDVGGVLEDSVAAHLVADVEVGVFLSSGIDSTLIAAIASGMNPRLRTFTLAFPDSPDIDESELAERNARLLGSLHTTVPVMSSELWGAAELITSIHGEPFGDAAALPLALLARRARQDVKVALTGEGADEVFGGYKRYRVSRWLENPLFRVSQWGTRTVARRLSRLRGDDPSLRAVEALLWGGGFRSHAALLLSDLNSLENGHRDPASDAALLARSDWAAMGRTAGERERARRFDLQRWLPNVYLEKADRATMSCGLEARVPYLDPAVIAFARSRRSTGFGKGNLREDLVRRLPAVATPPTKRGLSVDLHSLIRSRWRDLVRYEISSRGSVLDRFMSMEAKETLRLRCERSQTASFRVAMLGLWERTFSHLSFS
jgi:asparagine synthase (glutamine-hydrolysing)